MIFGLFLKAPWLRNFLSRIGFLPLYIECLSISARGFFFAYAVIFVIFLPLRALEFVLRLVDEHFGAVGIVEFAIAMASIAIAPLGLLIGVTAIDCLIAGVRARNQLFLGSMFSSKGHDERLHGLLEKINKA